MTDDKQDKRFRATTPRRRFMRLAGMSASIAKNYANHKVKGIFSSEEEKRKSLEELYVNIGKQIAETLGEMKGAVMKVGQIASQLKDLLPPEVATALETLQKESPPMPYSMIKRQIIRSLGEEPEVLFGSFEEKPFAAASIGQVHRATTKEGIECIVKIQYPGVKESCNSDLKHLKRLLKLAGLVKVSNEVIDQVFAEIKQILYEELDYEHEAENLQIFAEYYKDDPKIVIPKYFEELSSDKILTLEYVPGDPMQSLGEQGYSQETINEIGFNLFRAMGDQIYNLNVVHADPHPGNFAFRPDGTIIIYDFGAVKKVKAEIIQKLRTIVTDAMTKNCDNLDQHLRDVRARIPNSPNLPKEFYQEWLNIIMEPFDNNEPFDFSKSRVHRRAVKKARKDALKYIGYFQPAPEVMVVHRVVTGHYWNMVEMGVEAAFRPLIEEIVIAPNQSQG